jgi:NADPH:quinone reductase-like Zn-dependent oxidoreductase
MLAYVLDDDTVGLREIDSPEPGPGEVLIRVRASAMNPHDDHVRSGMARSYLDYDLPAVLGTDVAGEVAAIGSGVSRVAVGSRVFGLERSFRVHAGTFAEYVVLPEDFVAKTPPNIDDSTAGALGLASLTALKAIHAAQLEPGTTILINGATGGVGCYATQFAIAAGASVLATARAGAEADVMREMGAAATIDWTSEDVGEAAARTGGVQVLLDLVNFDPHGLDTLARRVLIPGGRALTTVAPGSSAEMIVSSCGPELLDLIAEQAARGELRARLRATFALVEIEDAFAELRSGGLGKVALSVG